MARVFRLPCIPVLVFLVLLAAASAASCAEVQEKYIKFVSAKNGKITLEVDGGKVSFPMPDGYVLMKEEHSPKEYTLLKETPHQLLCILVDKRDTKKKNETRVRTVTFYIDRAYVGIRFSPEGFAKEIANIKTFSDKLHVISNEKFKKMGRPEYFKKYLYENKSIISYMTLQNRPSPERKYRICISITEMLINDFILMFEFRDYVMNDKDVDTFEKDTVAYIKRISRN